LNYSYEYERPAVSADIAVFRRIEDELQILLILRKNPPYQGMWALPGGFMEIDESLEQTAIRELEEETGLKDIKLTQFRTFSQVDRDPRTRVVTIVFYGNVEPGKSDVKGGDDAAEARWFPAGDLPPLGFDHKAIIKLLTDCIP
jgi:8-oxo-dGTP diphosphatase